MLVEEAELAKALENPKSASVKDLMTSISRRLMENENVLLGLMSSEMALTRRLERGKEKVLGKEGMGKVRRKTPKYSNVAQLVNTG